MWLRWFPWKLLVSRAAQAGGLVDPVKVLARLEKFAQPLEGKVPLELIRGGLVMHSRGLLNTGAIQHNLDWIWPYWVERQYDPADDAFIPRAFSLTHINLTNRNWTAIGVPDCDALPIVDPRGLVTPFWDGWSLDAWIVARDGRGLIPSRCGRAEQSLEMNGRIAVTTRTRSEGMELLSTAHVEERERSADCVLLLRARSETDAYLVVSLRPYNPEGVSIVEAIQLDRPGNAWRLGKRQAVLFESAPERHAFSDYHSGDVHTRLFEGGEGEGVRCRAGMATAAALYPMAAEVERQVAIRVPLERPRRGSAPAGGGTGWDRELARTATLRVPDDRVRMLYDAAVRSLVLHSQGGETFPGPYTYKRFWFRDGAFMLHALLCVGLAERAEKVLDTFPRRQTPTGFYRSQEGEWDSNGEALWILNRYCELTGRDPKPEWRNSIRQGVRWIRRNRLPEDVVYPHAGLLPPGFSAEHLGPNDYYYWDDFWGIAGLLAGADLLSRAGKDPDVEVYREEAARFLRAVEKSLAGAASRLGRPGMPASPYRRLDSGTVGSLAAGYPLRIFSPHDPRLLDTVEFILSSCLANGGFYQDIIHSGVNPYLTLHVAQVLLRAGDPRFGELVRTVARLASPTGQWPEAVHPRTGGGCMGDGHHAWASAEWVLMIRNMFVREEGARLVLASGVFPEWLKGGEPIRFGPAPTSFGDVSVEVLPRETGAEVRWTGAWRTTAPGIEARIPGFRGAVAREGRDSALLEPGTAT